LKIRINLFGATGTSHGGGYNQQAVIYALRHCGYRLIDTARRYGCEELLGQAIEVSHVAPKFEYLVY
jgi:diketogulonate reductase-like aldo/keto reductase